MRKREPIPSGFDFLHELTTLDARLSAFMGEHKLDYTMRNGLMPVKPFNELEPAVQTEFTQLITPFMQRALRARKWDAALFYAEYLGRTDIIHQALNEGIQADSFPLTELLLQYARTEAEVSGLVNQYAVHDHHLDLFRSVPHIEDSFRAIQRSTDLYQEKYHFPNIGYDYASLELVNAAGELFPQSHDLVVGIAKSGVVLPMRLEMMGKTCRYIEWHKKQAQRPPEWVNMGCDTSKISSADTILVCDNDTQDGSTLRAIVPLLEALSPKQVDVAFYRRGFREGEAVVQRIGFYNTVINAVDDLPREHFYEHVQAAKDQCTNPAWLAQFEEK